MSDEALESDDTESNHEAAESAEPKQIGPRLQPQIAEDFEMIIRHRNNGKYKGRLSDEVQNAIKLYIGKAINENPAWKDDALSQSQRERLEEYSEEFQHTCANAPMDAYVTEELSKLRKEIQDMNTTNTRMLSQILTQMTEKNNAEAI